MPIAIKLRRPVAPAAPSREIRNPSMRVTVRDRPLQWRRKLRTTMPVNNGWEGSMGDSKLPRTRVSYSRHVFSIARRYANRMIVEAFGESSDIGMPSDAGYEPDNNDEDYQRVLAQSRQDVLPAEAYPPGYGQGEPSNAQQSMALVPGLLDCKANHLGSVLRASRRGG